MRKKSSNKAPTSSSGTQSLWGFASRTLPAHPLHTRSVDIDSNSCANSMKVLKDFIGAHTLEFYTLDAAGVEFARPPKSVLFRPPIRVNGTYVSALVSPYSSVPGHVSGWRRIGPGVWPGHCAVTIRHRSRAELPFGVPAVFLLPSP